MLNKIHIRKFVRSHSPSRNNGKKEKYRGSRSKKKKYQNKRSRKIYSRSKKRSRK